MPISKKTILYITQLFPFPPDSGGRIKSLNTIQTLSKKFNIILICFEKNKPPKQSLQKLKKYTKQIKVFELPEIDQEPKKNIRKLLKSYLKLQPYYACQFYSIKAEKYIKKTIDSKNPEIIHIDHVNMAQYLPDVKKQKWILEEHNMEYKLSWDKFINFSEIKKTKIYLFVEFILTYLFERRFLKKFDHIFSISNYDKQMIEDKFKISKVSTQQLVYSNTKTRNKLQNKNINEILFIGDITWTPNKVAVSWFIEKILPIILKSKPTTILNIVGKIENDFVDLYKIHKNVNFFGFQKDIKKYMNRAVLFILPFKVGGGIRVKSLTAFAHSVPIVTTNIGIQGIDGENYRDYLIANEAKEFATACLLLIKNRKIRITIGKNGEKYLLRNHSTLNNSEFLKEYIKITQ